MEANDMAAQIFHQRALRFAKHEDADAVEVSDFPVLAFLVADETYLLALGEITGVLPYSNCTPVPKSDPAICGLINVRGEIHCVLALSTLLDLDTPEKDSGGGYVILLKSYGMGLRVSQVDRILNLRKSELEALEKRLEIPARYGKGIIQGGIFLDMEEIAGHPIFMGGTLEG